MLGSLGVTGVFDGTFDGYLCVIYAHYYDKLNFIQIVPDSDYQKSLSEEVYIATDYEKSVKVLKGVKKKISSQTERLIFSAFNSYEDCRFMLIYNYLIKAFKVGRKIDEILSDSDVFNTHRLANNYNSEGHLLSGFCRFSKTDNGIYYSKITPKCFVLPFLAEHFIDRLKNERWVIHDKTHKKAAIYDTNDYIIASVDDTVNYKTDADEQMYSELWRVFHKSVAIEERKNYKCQRTQMPLWYRNNMTEFQASSEKDSKLLEISKKNE